MSLQLDLFGAPKLPSLIELVEQAKRCTACALHCQEGGGVAFYDGSPTARIVFVGEAPGENEAKLGKPFVGRAGQLLDKALQAVNLNRASDIYITNICKHRPEKNRTPTIAEQKICADLFLRTELELLKPYIIVPLGTPALKFFKPDMRTITSERGKFFKWNNSFVLPMFHPAYVLRNPDRSVGSPADLLWKDFLLLKSSIDERIWEQ